ncbi:MAG: N-acetylmuramoyl-L-alanine amidase [Clostridia bacterium]|nr:N-acetylmuramoyl-L-alanine amidase [Clostridia bacterium]
MEVKKRLVSPSKYSLKCPYPMTPVGICVHNTYNDASAENEIAYMTGNDLATSFHYAVDDKEVVQGIPEDRCAFHAGDGREGEGNREFIGLEICYSRSGGDRFIKAEKNAAVFIAAKLKEYGWDISRVRKHQDFSGKYCPHRTLDMGWSRFLAMIQTELTKEADELTREEVQAMIDASKEKVYHYWDELPLWAHDPIMALYRKGYFFGAAPDDLDLSYGTMRTLTVLARALKAEGKIEY